MYTIDTLDKLDIFCVNLIYDIRYILYILSITSIHETLDLLYTHQLYTVYCDFKYNVCNMSLMYALLTLQTD